MLVEITPKREELSTDPREVDIAISDDQSLSLSWSVPSWAESDEITDLALDKVSIQDVVAFDRDHLREFAHYERDQLLKKYESYRDSTTYLTHLASLSQLAGDLQAADRFLREAEEKESDPLFVHKRAKLAIASGNIHEGYSCLNESGHLANDSFANLLVAYMSLLQGKVDQAQKSVNAALAIDELDPSAMTLAGILELKKRSFSTAIRYFKSVSEERPLSASTFVNLATAYSYSGNRTKAINALRRAVAINPIDENAVVFYADLLFKEQRFEEALHTLQRFVKYEQKSIPVWNRLAQAHYHLTDYTGALQAFKHQASVAPTLDVWNNIALVYWRLKDKIRAYRYFQLALDELSRTSEPSYLVVSNFLKFLTSEKYYEEIYTWTKAFLSEHREETIKSEPNLSAILTHHINALSKLDKGKEAISRTESLLKQTALDPRLKSDLLLFATYYYSLIDFESDKALHFSDLILEELENNRGQELETKTKLVNNIVYVWLECDRLEMGEQFIPLLSARVHKDPSVTATFGLRHLKKGNLNRGEELYREAMFLAGEDKELRENIQQKMNLEIAKAHHHQGNDRIAGKYLKKVLSRKQQILSQIRKDALTLREKLRNR